MPTKDEINRAIHEFMGKCWHEFEPYRAIHGTDKCLKKGCRVTRYDKDEWHSDYTSSDSPRRLLEEVVAKLSNPPSQNMWRALAELLEQESGEAHPWIDVFVTATAEQIATACYRVIESNAATTPETRKTEAQDGGNDA